MIYYFANMNRALGMPYQLFLVSVACLSMVACQSHPCSFVDDDVSPPTTIPCCQYVISGGVPHPGPRTLLAGDTVSIVLARDFPNAAARPCTIILIRQAPEGKTRQLIQLDASGKLVNEKQDWVLRNGDELVFPGGQGSNSTRNPTGPPARTPD
jgi:hypothetical protein